MMSRAYLLSDMKIRDPQRFDQIFHRAESVRTLDGFVLPRGRMIGSDRSARYTTGKEVRRWVDRTRS